MAGDAAGFWSYVRQDNDGDHGRIEALAKDLREQYRLLTAEDLELFVDRESLLWGEAWKDRIDSAIAGTTFFIPIITPSYFRSQECRRELLKFAREAERLGLGELLMSVYWVRVPELEEEPEQSADEAIRLVAKYNRQDFRDERLEDRDSSGYRKAVATLAAELAKHAELARQVKDAPNEVLTAESDEDDGPGIIERLAVGEDAMPQAIALLGKIGRHLGGLNEKLERAGAELQAAANRGQGIKSALRITNRLASELTQPAAEISATGHEYSHVLAELDTNVNARLDLFEAIEEHSPERDQYLRELIDLKTAALGMQEGLEEMLDAAEPVATFSRSLRAPLENMRSGVRGVLDGNAVISEWARRALVLLDTEEGND